MKKLSNFIKRFPIILDAAHSLGAIILTLDMCMFINSFEASQFLDWNITEQIVFRTLGAFIFGLIVSYIWEAEIQGNRLGMPPSERDVINMTACATLTGAFLPYLNVGLITLIVASALLILTVIVYIKMYLNNKKQ
jgi:hypothetical protein